MFQLPNSQLVPGVLNSFPSPKCGFFSVFSPSFPPYFWREIFGLKKKAGEMKGIRFGLGIGVEKKRIGRRTNCLTKVVLTQKIRKTQIWGKNIGPRGFFKPVSNVSRKISINDVLKSMKSILTIGGSRCRRKIRTFKSA